MTPTRTIEGTPGAGGARIAVAVARFNGFVTEALLNGALETLKHSGIDDEATTVVRVPGCYEMPLVVDRLASSGDYDGVVALGCVIRGATAHFDYVAGECSRGLSEAMRRHGVPVAFGIVTTETIEQALERAGIKGANKGADAAATVLEMVNLLSKL